MKHLLSCLLVFVFSLISAAIVAVPESGMATDQPSLVASAYFERAFDRNGKKGRTIRFQNGIYYHQGRKKSRLGYLFATSAPALQICLLRY